MTKVEQSLPLEALVEAFEARLPQISSEVRLRSRGEIGEWTEIESPEVWEQVEKIIRGSRLSQAEHLRVGMHLPQSCPPADRDAADLAVRAGVSLPAALKSYRIAYGVTWQAWLNSIEELGLEGSRQSALLRSVSRFASAYDERLMDLFSEAFCQGQDRRRANGERDLEIVHEMLTGLRDDLPGLGYDPRGGHIALVAWDGDPERALRHLSVEVGSKLLAVRVHDGLGWGWLGEPRSPGKLSSSRAEAIESRFGSRAAIGTLESGVEGFRRSHRLAGAAHRVAAQGKRSITLYADVGLEALALADDASACDFVRAQLAPLEDRGARTAELKATLAQYFVSSQNAAATASAMGVHEQTVARRLRVVETLFGCSVNARRPELELALRLEQMLERDP